jgi:adenine C2-methylase RlmN of 23S rRNA A2503 and tRNA A37
VGEVPGQTHGRQAATLGGVDLELLDSLADRPYRRRQALALADALELARAFKVNLIPTTRTGSGFGGSTREAIAAFKSALEARGLRTTVRLTRGRDIDAACGQLAARR